MKALLSLFVLLITNQLLAQADRYRFAETYFGLETEIALENNYFNSPSNGESQKLASSLSPRLLIGGTHFWGHADFYISIPLYSLPFNGSKAIKQSNSTFTGFRLLPFKLKNNSLRPYLGLGLNSKELKPKDGPLYSNWQCFYEGGFQYRKKNKILGLGIRYFENNSFQAALTRSDIQKINSSPFSFSLYYSWVFDGTAGYSSQGSKKYMSNIYALAKEKRAFNTYSIAVGLNALIPLEKTELASQQAFFNDEIEGKLSPDLSLGYYHSGLDASLRLSFRPLKQKEEAYGYSHELARYSTALEFIKFIGDYHGFVPFVGPYVSHDYYRLSEKDQGQSMIDYSTHKPGYGLVFGWDIRLTELDYLILRTNLRYSPNYSYDYKGFNFSSKQIEFNFIQLVFYPERIKIYKKWNKQ